MVYFQEHHIVWGWTFSIYLYNAIKSVIFFLTMISYSRVTDLSTKVVFKYHHFTMYYIF